MAKLRIIRDGGAVSIGKATYNIPEGYTNEEVEAAVKRMKAEKGWKDTPRLIGRTR